MAEPIVRSFVIDTTESEQNLKELNVQINATSGAIDNTAQSFDNVATAEQEVVASSKSLKAQLRDLQAQLANTEPDSAKYRELAAAAGELKDKISDAAEAVGTQAGGAFERVGGSLGLVTSRIANLDFTGAAEGAKQLAANIGQVKPGDIAKGIQGIGSAFASVGKALLTNPIFLVGAAIAAAIVYADELLSLIDGVTDAEQEALNVQKERAAQSKQQLDAIGEQENILKLQGKTEREILQLKIAQANQAILDQKAVIQTTEIQRQAQIDAAERNRKIVSGILQFLTAPLQLILAQLDLVTKTARDLGVISEETFAKVGNLRDKFNTSISTLAFDPAEVAKEGDKAVAEQKKILQQLENQQAGFQLSIKSIDDKAATERKTSAEKNAADLLKIEQELNKQILDARRKTAEESAKITEQIRKDAAKPVESTKTELSNFDAEIKAQRDAQAFSISLMEEGTAKEIAAVDLKYQIMRDAAQGNADQIKLIAQQNADEVAAIEEAAAQKRKANEFAVQDAKLQATSDALGAINGLVAAFAKGDEKRAKQAFKIQKAVSIAQATVDTAESLPFRYQNVLDIVRWA